ncbi:hypothetical protein [Deinococcus sp. S9]|uniref:hypothetical protein n=1 Tax=Deinococcus sp. S9 TaxID=2545754 RepID=UPI0010560B76|nr:hypothetical protein [Deinococcus sp. S9]TDE84832.1 hypothetical protein E0686_15115 [Deinococcus sp. S9]
MSLLRRTALIDQVITASGHVLLCGPSGYGKTVLLEQLALTLPGAVLITATPTDTVASLLERASAAGTEHQVCLIDDAYLLPPEEVAALLKIPPTLRRLILVVRHLQYARVQLLLQKRQLTVLDAADLTFSLEELTTFQDGMSPHNLMNQTLGWPALVNIRLHPYGDVDGYLDDLLEEVESHARELLIDVATRDHWEAFLLIMQREGQLASLLGCGFPIIHVGGQFSIHPAMRRHLQERVGLGIENLRQQDTALKDLLDLTGRLTPDEMVTLMQRFFAHYGEDDSEVLEKVQLLSSVPLPSLPPHLRDMYASYLIMAGQQREAEYVLLKQQEFGTDTSRTYILLGRLAARMNKLATWAQTLQLARERAMTDEDCSRYYGYLSNYYVRCNRYDDAEQAAEKNLEYALRSRNLSQHFSALSNVAYARQMKGNLLGAKDAVLEGLELAEREGNRYVPQVVYLTFQLSEVLKDTGAFDEALDLIQRGLNFQQPNLAAIPYLYNTRGLIYLEFGRLDDALVNFEAAIDGFHARGNVVGLLMPHTFAAYALYRLGWLDRIAEHSLALRDVVSRITASSAEYTEPGAYLPLVDGLALLARGDPDGAVRALESIALEGRLTYDSVLLATLLAGKIRVAQGRYTQEQARLLVEILNARGSTTDVTARMYRAEFEVVYRACLALNVEPERFHRILEIPEPKLATRPVYPLHLLTLGRISLIAAGREHDLNPAYAAYALAYLHLKSDWKTADSMGDDLYTLTSDPRRNAQKSMSLLRQLLRRLDPEVERTLLSPKHDPRGYRVESSDQVHLSADVDPYLGAHYSPQNPDVAELEDLLSRVAVFLPGLPDSAFAREINQRLEDRTVKVARHLAEVYQRQGDVAAAARVLLTGLRFVPAPELGDALGQVLPELQVAARPPVRSVLQLVLGDGDQNLGDVITDALAAI